MKPRPKPLLGLLIGFVLGLVVVGLLWQLGVAPPDRFILFGILAVSIALVELLLTQTTRRGKKRFVTSMVIAGVFGGVALTGIPETFMNGGSISDGCTLTITSSIDEATPTDTSAFDPFNANPDDTISFTSSTDTVLTNWDSGLGMLIGGIPLDLWTAERANDEGSTQWVGEESVETYLNRIQDDTGLQVRGTYHVYGYIHADEGDCEMAGYIRIHAEGAFATPLIIALWVATALLVVIVIALAVSVRRSIREAKAYNAANATSTATGSGGTGGYAAPNAEPVGAFTAPEPVVTQPDAGKTPARPAGAAAAGLGAAVGAGAAAADRSDRADEPLAQTHVMPTADTEVLPVAEPEPAAEEPPAEEPPAEEPPLDTPADEPTTDEPPLDEPPADEPSREEPKAP